MGSGRWEAEAITGRAACWAWCSPLLLPLGGKGVVPCPRSRSRRGEADLGRLAGGRGIGVCLVLVSGALMCVWSVQRGIGVCLVTGTGQDRMRRRWMVLRAEEQSSQ